MQLNSVHNFTELPDVKAKRSKFKITNKHMTTFDAADLIPVYINEVVPGDTLNMNMSTVVRMATPLYPTMDEAFLDVYWFYCESRLLWEHWTNMWGENPNPWYPTTEYKVPQIKTDSNHLFQPKTIADYMGVPTNIAGLSVNALPFRFYVKTWNDWFRSTPLQQQAANYFQDSDRNAAANGDPMTYAYTGGTAPLKANKTHDYFTSALPSIMRGPVPLIPLGSWAPVTTRDEDTPERASNYGLKWRQDSISDEPFTTGDHLISGYATNGSYEMTGTSYVKTAEPAGGSGAYEIYPSNLWTDLSLAQSASISQLREALAVTHFYEKMAIGGGRYKELLENIYGVTAPDLELDRTEFLGAKRIPLNINTVLQQSATSNTSPLGQTGAYSHTADADDYFTKSFTQHGYVMCLVCVRYQHSYNQGLERMWSKKSWEDFFVPQLEALSEQAILNKELYAQGTSEDDEAFGYQERYSEYKYKPNQITGAFRTTYAQTLDAWHYGDHYTSLPVLGSTWIQESKANIDRTLAVSSGVENQFIADFYFDATWVRPMQIYAVPGLETV